MIQQGKVRGAGGLLRFFLWLVGGDYLEEMAWPKFVLFFLVGRNIYIYYIYIYLFIYTNIIDECGGLCQN